MRRTLIASLAMGAALAGAAPAHAETRYVKVGGLNFGTCTSEASACSYTRVLNGAGSVAGDTVIVLPGTYDVSAANVEINRKLDIRGQAGQPRPVFRDTTAGAAPFRVIAAGADTSLQHLEIEATVTSAFAATPKVTISDVEIRGKQGCAYAQGAGTSLTDVRLVHGFGGGLGTCLSIGNTATGARLRKVDVVIEGTGAGSYGFSTSAADADLEDVTLTGGGAGFYASGSPLDPGHPARLRRVTVSSGQLAVSLGSNVVFTDSVARANGTGARALDVIGTPVMRNVTAVATGTGSRGLSMPALPSEFALTARNLVLRGDEADVRIEPDGTHSIFAPGDPICISMPSMCAPMPIYAPDLTLTHSNFRTLDGPLAPGSTANGNGDPQFVDPAAGNFRPGPGSPLVDAGAADPDNGPTDLDGKPRTSGAAPDVGAYESDAATPGGGSSGEMVPPPPDMSTVPPDTTGPGLSALRVSNRRFRVARAATPVAAGRTRRAPAGTTFRYSSSEAASSMLQIGRAAAGRRSGRACVKPTRRLRRARKCTRYLRAGVLARSALPGLNEVAFSGRIGRKALKPGNYMLTVTANDLAGNMTPRGVSGKFKIVKR